MITKNQPLMLAALTVIVMGGVVMVVHIYSVLTAHDLSYQHQLIAAHRAIPVTLTKGTQLAVLIALGFNVIFVALAASAISLLITAVKMVRGDTQVTA